MKLTIALIASLVTGAFSKEMSIKEVKADSKFGMDLLSKSRRVEEDGEADNTWISGFALKFQGCHHIAQWNQDADDEEDVRIETKRLARFRLCPVSSCSDQSGYGCKSGYGDYIVDMDDFLVSYLENKQEVEEQACETYREYNCDCEDGDDKDDAFDGDKCEYQCFTAAGMSECIDEDYYQYQNNGQAEQLALDDYLVCAAYEGVEQNDDANNRKLEDAAAGYYVGPYCSDNGGEIRLGMFTDDACTVFADDYGGRVAFSDISGGATLPYSSDSIVDTKCYSCEEAQENNDDANGDDAAVEAKEVCTDMYTASGKCEEDIGYSSNQNACTYMEGIKMTRKDGILFTGAASANAVAGTFIVIFGLSFACLGSYVYYLKTKLDRGSINLSD